MKSSCCWTNVRCCPKDYQEGGKESRQEAHRGDRGKRAWLGYGGGHGTRLCGEHVRNQVQGEPLHAGMTKKFTAKVAKPAENIGTQMNTDLLDHKNKSQRLSVYIRVRFLWFPSMHGARFRI
jgi:hypothetical protein